MAMCDVSELFDYWSQFPPMHILMRGYVGYKPEPKHEEKPRGIVGERPWKLSNATPKEKEIFEQLRKHNA
jgi:hypothetical protein